jgi:hypothetical protein
MEAALAAPCVLNPPEMESARGLTIAMSLGRLLALMRSTTALGFEEEM